MSAERRTTRAQGRRVAEQAPGPVWTATLTVAAVAVLVTVLAVVLHAPSQGPVGPGAEPPREEPLRAATLACPAALPGSPPITVVSTAGSEQGLSARPVGGDERDLEPSPAGVADVTGVTGAAVVTGRDDAAPGLFGARLGGRAPAAGECVRPSGEEWFVGVGAGGFHSSRLQLVNPDSGPAVAEVTLWSTEGEMEELQSRGLTVAGNASSVLDLTRLAPHRNDLAMRVRVVRGRLGASVEDSYGSASEEPSRDWLAATAAPATDLVLPGLTRLAEERTLVLVNPGEDAGRVGVRVIGKESTFAPAQIEEIELPAGRTVTVDLGAIAGLVGREDTGLRLTSTVPVAASVRSVLAGDVVSTPATPPASGLQASVAGPGTGTLVLTGETAAVVEVRFPGAPEGTTWRGRLRPGASLPVPVPDAARAVVVDSSAAYAGAVRMSGPGGSALLPLRPLVLVEQVPDVRPEWP